MEFSGQFEKALQFACGNSLVCDTLEVARHVCYDKGLDVKGEFPAALSSRFRGGGLKRFL